MKKYIFSAFCLMSFVLSQKTIEGLPMSFSNQLTEEYHVIEMPVVDVQKLLDEDAIAPAGTPTRYGKSHYVDYNLENSGTWEVIPSQGRVWRLKIISRNAFAIGIYYDNYLLPEGAMFFVYNESEEMVHGAYSALNNQDDGLFATPLIEGDTIILEYFEPDNASFNGTIEIERIVHDYRDILNFNNQNTPSSRCGANVVCPEGEDFIDQINAGSWLDMGSYICSGSMVNNTSNDLTPYYMTAWHCTDDQNESTFRFYFNYETETCEGSNASYGSYSYGSILIATSGDIDPDFTLLEITDEISDTWDDVFYAGWDRSSSPPLVNSGVHHPGGDPKKINFDDDYATHSPGINWADGAGYSPPGSHWGINWDFGCTEGGSSGSPAYNSDGRFIGQLTGGSGYAYYGKFSRGWDGDSPATRLKDWLDPDNTNQMTLDGVYIDVNHPVFVLNSINIEEVGGDDDSVINPGETGEITFYIEVPDLWLTGASNVSLVLLSDESDITISNGEFSIPYANPGDVYDNADSPFSVIFDEDAALGGYQFNLFLAYNGPGDTSYEQDIEFTIDLTLNQQGWPFVTPNQVVTSPAIVDIDSDGEVEVIFSDYGGFVRVVNVSGEELCSFDTGNQIWGSPTVGDVDNDNELEIITTSKSKHLYVLDSGCNLELDYDAGQFLMGTPALGDIDGDGDLEIVFGGYSSPGKIFAINGDGSNVSGFPFELGEKIQRGIALADFNSNGKVDIVCGTDSERLWLIYDDLTVANGFPFEADNDFRTAPSVFDVNGEKIICSGSRDDNFYCVNSDGSIRFQIETGGDINTSSGYINLGNEIGIFFGSSNGTLYGVNSEGNALTSWPISTGSGVNSSPVFADLDNDGNVEVIAGTEGGSMLAYHLDGTAFPLFPIINYDVSFTGSPAVVDTDNDGDLEILMGSGGSVVNVDVKDIGNSNDYWNMFRGNLYRTGYFGSGSGTISVDHIPDWNLVGLPMEVTDPYYLMVYPDAIEGTLFSFDDNYNLEENFILGEGYWLRFLDAGSTTISGVAVTTLTVPLAESWNLISGITTAVNVTDIDDPDNLIIPGTFFAFTGSYELTETLNPGFGYWVRSSGDGEVTISSSSTAAKSLPFRNRLQEANSLTFSNGDNSLVTLHFGVTVPEDEKLRYSLPPLPPEGGFDVRFSGDWKYTKEEGEIMIQNDRYPLVINYENKREIEAGMEWILVDPQDGKEFVLNNGEIQITAPVQSLILTKRNIVPREFVLHQNYPNPFNPVTSLRYDLPERSQVTLTVYDLMGRKVTQLVNTTQEAGFRSVQWNATDTFGKPVSAGVYLYTIQAGEFVQTRKMVLLK